MQLTIRDAAGLLKLPEAALRRWVRQGGMPFCRVNDQVRFNRTELLEWAAARGLAVAPDAFRRAPAAAGESVRLAAALERGGICHGVVAGDKEEALRAAVERLRLPPEIDREQLLHFLLAREAMAPTGVGEGIAVPHVRNPLVLAVPEPVAGLCFLERPVSFGALDGRPVHTLFTLASPTVRHHLHLLACLTFALRDDTFRAAVAGRAAAADILAAACAVDERLAGPPVPAGATEAAGR